MVFLSIKETIEINIEDLKSQVETLGRHVKALLRESLGVERQAESTVSTVLQPIDFSLLED